jgi:LAS superfamily LD-carboxypeptidase LdcB
MSFKKLVLFILTMVININASAQEFTKEDLIGKGSPVFFGEGYSLNEEAYKAFLEMKDAALKDGINIKVVSSYRNFEKQKSIWETKYKRFTSQGLSPQDAINKIIEYSTIPGTSRHHWGTDIDIIDENGKYSGDVLVPSKFHGNGPFCKLKDWLDLNANKYGFYLVYTNNSNRKGFKYEPWHYSYASVSIPMLKAYKKLNIKNILLEENLLGSEYFTDEFIDKYLKENVLDINAELID